MSDTIRAGEAFVRLSEENKALLAAMEAAGRKALPNVRKLAAQATSNDEAWQEAFGEPFPADLSDWRRWAKRLRYDVNQVPELEFDELLDFIEGELLRQKDRRDAKPPEVLVYRGDGLFLRGTKALRLEGQEQLVMEALVELRAASKDRLIEQSGVADAVTVLKRVKEKHPMLADAIIIPGGRDRGGYQLEVAGPE